MENETNDFPRTVFAGNFGKVEEIVSGVYNVPTYMIEDGKVECDESADLDGRERFYVGNILGISAEDLWRHNPVDMDDKNASRFYVDTKQVFKILHETQNGYAVAPVSRIAEAKRALDSYLTELAESMEEEND